MVPPPPPLPMASGQVEAAPGVPQIMDPSLSVNSAQSDPAMAPSANNGVIVQQPQQIVPAPPPMQTGIIPPPPPPRPASSSVDTMKVPRKSHSMHNNNSSVMDPRNLVSTISKTVIPASSYNNNNKSHKNDSGVKKILPPLNLPPGVTLPPGMDPSVLLTSDRALALIKELSPTQVQAALNEFDEAIRNKGDKVRNLQAYLVGVIRRYLHVNRKERSAAGAPIMGNDITPVVKVGLFFYFLKLVLLA